MKHNHELIAEAGFNELTPEEKAKICNGAGASSDWRSALIPNTLWGLDCTQVFDLHDYAYHVGRTYEDKCRADISMLINLIRFINFNGGWLAVPRRYRAVTYYDAVHELGDDAFFSIEKGNMELLPKDEFIIHGSTAVKLK